MIEVMILVILFSTVLCFYRLAKGPTVLDRIAAADSIGVMALIILVLLSFHYQRQIFIDVALAYGLLLFIDVLIMAKYFGKKEGENN